MEVPTDENSVPPTSLRKLSIEGNIVRSPLKDSTNSYSSFLDKSGGVGGSDRLKNRSLLESPPIDETINSAPVSPSKSPPDTDTDTTADYESAGEPEDTEDELNKTDNLSCLASQLEGCHLSTPKAHQAVGFPFNSPGISGLNKSCLNVSIELIEPTELFKKEQAKVNTSLATNNQGGSLSPPPEQAADTSIVTKSPEAFNLSCDSVGTDANESVETVHELNINETVGLNSTKAIHELNLTDQNFSISFADKTSIDYENFNRLPRAESTQSNIQVDSPLENESFNLSVGAKEKKHFNSPAQLEDCSTSYSNSSQLPALNVALINSTLESLLQDSLSISFPKNSSELLDKSENAHSINLNESKSQLFHVNPEPVLSGEPYCVPSDVELETSVCNTSAVIDQEIKSKCSLEKEVKVVSDEGKPIELSSSKEQLSDKPNELNVTAPDFDICKENVQVLDLSKEVESESCSEKESPSDTCLTTEQGVNTQFEGTVPDKLVNTSIVGNADCNLTSAVPQVVDPQTVVDEKVNLLNEDVNLEDDVAQKAAEKTISIVCDPSNDSVSDVVVKLIENVKKKEKTFNEDVESAKDSVPLTAEVPPISPKASQDINWSFSGEKVCSASTFTEESVVSAPVLSPKNTVDPFLNENGGLNDQIIETEIKVFERAPKKTGHLPPVCVTAQCFEKIKPQVIQDVEYESDSQLPALEPACLNNTHKNEGSESNQVLLNGSHDLKQTVDAVPLKNTEISDLSVGKETSVPRTSLTESDRDSRPIVVTKFCFQLAESPESVHSLDLKSKEPHTPDTVNSSESSPTLESIPKINQVNGCDSQNPVINLEEQFKIDESKKVSSGVISSDEIVIKLNELSVSSVEHLNALDSSEQVEFKVPLAKSPEVITSRLPAKVDEPSLSAQQVSVAFTSLPLIPKGTPLTPKLIEQPLEVPAPPEKPGQQAPAVNTREQSVPTQSKSTEDNSDKVSPPAPSPIKRVEEGSQIPSVSKGPEMNNMCESTFTLGSRGDGDVSYEGASGVKWRSMIEEDSMKDTSLIGVSLSEIQEATLESLTESNKSYKDMSDLIATCSQQERDLASPNFEVSFREEAERLAQHVLTSPQHESKRKMQPDPSSDMNQSEAGPITADEDFNNKEELFQEAAGFDFDYLSKVGCGHSKATKLTRQSLYVKFDPLVGSLLSSTESPTHHIFKRPGVSDENMAHENSGESGVKVEDSTPGQEVETSEETNNDRLIDITPPKSKHETTPTAKVAPTTPSNLKSKTNVTPSQLTPRQDILKREISKLQDLMIQQEQSFQEQLVEKTELVEKLKKRVSELESREPRGDLEARLKASEAKVAKLKKDLSETTLNKKQLMSVVEEYEKTIAQLVTKDVDNKKRAEEEKAAIASERDAALQHLNNMEVAFNDIHSKYEKCKGVIESMKNNETQLKTCLAENEKTIMRQESDYQKLKTHASEKLEAANDELATLKKAHQAEIAKMKAIAKKAEVRVKSLEDSLEQKNKEVRELTQICDDLIGKVESN